MRMTGVSSKEFISQLQPWFRTLSARGFLIRQIFSYIWAGSLAALAHYGLLIGLVELFRADAVTAALCGYSAGGYISYCLNRRHTFQSERPHREAVWRFCLVAAFGFGLTFVLMHMMIDRNHVPYLLAQIVTTLAVMVWTFAANRAFTFRTMEIQAED